MRTKKDKKKRARPDYANDLKDLDSIADVSALGLAQPDDLEDSLAEGSNDKDNAMNQALSQVIRWFPGCSHNTR